MPQYDVYKHKKSNKQLIILHEYVLPVCIYGKWYSIPTTVDILDVEDKKVQTISAKDFRTSVAKGYLILVH